MSTGFTGEMRVSTVSGPLSFETLASMDQEDLPLANCLDYSLRTVQRQVISVKVVGYTKKLALIGFGHYKLLQITGVTCAYGTKFVTEDLKGMRATGWPSEKVLTWDGAVGVGTANSNGWLPDNSVNIYNLQLEGARPFFVCNGTERYFVAEHTELLEDDAWQF